MAMYPFSTLADETLITYSHLIEENNEKIVYVHFERPTNDGFDSIRCRLPSYEWTVKEGRYTSEEIAMFERMLRDGAHIFYELAEAGGFDFANAV